MRRLPILDISPHRILNESGQGLAVGQYLFSGLAKLGRDADGWDGGGLHEGLRALHL